MCNTFVAVDTGFPCFEGALVLPVRARPLFVQRHGLKLVAIATLAGVGCFH